MKRRIATLLIAIITTMQLMTPAFGEALNPNDINAQSAILLDADTGQVLFEKNADAKQFPASTTKALTALIIAEDLKLDEKVVIDHDTPFTTGSRIYVIEGESFTVEQLLYAMLLESANDAAIALAKYHSGTIEQFAKKMNERAKQLGCTNSNFVNPNGLPDDNHVTSARDLAIIGRAFEKHPELMAIVRMAKYDLPPTNKQPEVRHLNNSNRFLYGTGYRNKVQYKGTNIDIKWDAVTGLKTGYTNVAQQCFIVSATQNNRNLIAVILKATGNNLYTDPRAMLEYGFTQFKPFQFAVKGQLMESTTIDGPKKAKVDLYTTSDVKALLPLGADEKAVTTKVELMPNLKLPIKENQVLGQLKISYNNQLLTSTNLVSLATIGSDATLGKDTKRYTDWIPFDTSQSGLINLGLRLLAAVVLWQLAVRFLSGRKKNKARPRKRRPAQSMGRPNPYPPQGPRPQRMKAPNARPQNSYPQQQQQSMPSRPPHRNNSRPSQQPPRKSPRPPMNGMPNSQGQPRPRPDYLQDVTYRPKKKSN